MYAPFPPTGRGGLEWGFGKKFDYNGIQKYPELNYSNPYSNGDY